MNLAKSNVLARTAIASAISTIVANSVIAQEAPSQNTMLEEIVVTAQKRESTLQETPLSVTAITGDQLSALGLISPQDVANFTPSMSYQEVAGGGEGNRIYLRGVGRETSVLGTEPGVGLYNNGFYTNESSILSGSVDRIERIEVLRGPQGTLYGRNTTAGAINVVAKRPTEDFEGIARVTLGDYSKRTAELTVSGPMSEDFGYLVNIRKNTQDSFYTNLAGPDPIGVDEEYAELQVQWNISDDTSWNVRTFTASFENETLPMSHLSAYRNYSSEAMPPMRLGQLTVNPELFVGTAEAPTMSDPFTISQDFQGKVAIDGSINLQSTFEMDFDAFTLRVLNGYADFEWYGEKDSDGTASVISQIEKIGQEETSMQHEIQLISNGSSNFEWVVGAFYFDIENTQPYALAEPNNPYLVNAIYAAPDGSIYPIPNPEGNYYHQEGRLDASSTAIYGQFDWSLSDSMVLTAGLRYSEDEKTGSETRRIIYDSGLCYDAVDALLPLYVGGGNPYVDLCANGAISPFIPNRAGLLISDDAANHSASWDALDWKVSLAYDLSESSMAYASVTTGYKPGGFRLGGMQDDPTTAGNESVVDNEELIAYEMGYKGRFGDALNVSAAIFQYDYSDMQVELPILDAVSGIATDRLANAPKASLTGFEVEATWGITDNLVLLGNYSHVETEIKEDFFVQDIKTYQVRNVNGNELNRSPNDKYSIGVYYTMPVGENTIDFTGSYSYTGDQYVSIFNDDVDRVEGYDIINARMTFRPANGNYEVSLFGQNLGDTVSYANGLMTTDLLDGARQYGRALNPRTMGIEFAVFF